MREPKETPIIPNSVCRLNLSDEEYLVVAASADSIQMFDDSRLNYLRYWDQETNTLKACWLGHAVLAELTDFGIPITRRKTITETEVEAHKAFCWASAQAEYFDQGLATLEDAVIETECREALDIEPNLDAEIQYYLGEGGEWVS